MPVNANNSHNRRERSPGLALVPLRIELTEREILADLAYPASPPAASPAASER